MKLEKLKEKVIIDLELCKESDKKFMTKLEEYLYYREFYIDYLNSQIEEDKNARPNYSWR